MRSSPTYLRICASDEKMSGMTTAPGTDAIQPDAAVPTTEGERQRYAAVSRALADAKRLCVLECLARGERSVSDLSREAGCHVPNMSQHLAVLRAAGLVESRREGNTVLYRLTDPRILEAYQLIKSVAD
jgi:DNA-binding transcriptional ArsR family regulator